MSQPAIDYLAAFLKEEAAKMEAFLAFLAAQAARDTKDKTDGA